MDLLGNIQSTLLSKSLDGLWAREQAISNNIANLDTPNYKGYKVSFEDQLKEAIGKGSESLSGIKKQVSNVEPKYEITENLTMRLDGNNVDIEAEQLEMARTQLNYLYSLRQISDQFSRMRYVIKEAR